jgi:hypothetical protein
MLVNSTEPYPISDEENFENGKILKLQKTSINIPTSKLGLDLKSKLDTKEGFCFDFVVQKHNWNS